MTKAICHKNFCRWEGDLDKCKAFPNTHHINQDGTKEMKTAYYCPKCGWGIHDFEEDKNET